jgi:hypothetical protein
VTPDTLILDCYRLAKFYHIDPGVFLDMPLSEVRRHLYWTGKLHQEIRQAQEEAAQQF